MNGVSQDLRYAVRTLLKAPGFTLVTILTLALGIGANTAVFTTVKAVLINPLPFPDPGRLVDIYGFSVDTGNFEQWRKQATSFEQMSEVSFDLVRLRRSTADQIEQVEGLSVSPDFFPMLGITPLFGRAPAPEDFKAGAPDVVVISSKLAEEQFGSATDSIGNSLIIDGQPHTVIGVIPLARIPLPSDTQEFIEPMRPGGRATVGEIWARMKPGVSFQHAASEVRTIGKRFPRSPYARPQDPPVQFETFRERIDGYYRPMLLTLTAAVAFILLIACVNVANLFLARISARQREIAVRTALGASRARIARQLFTEGVLLSLLGAAAGLVLAAWTTALFRALEPYRIARIEEARLDPGVLLFTGSISVLTAILFSLAPSFTATKRDVNQAIQRGLFPGGLNRGEIRQRGLLVVAELALTVVMLAGAGLLIRTFLVLRPVNPGFDPQGKLAMRVRFPEADSAQRLAEFRTIIERLQALPGVLRVTSASSLPMEGMTMIPQISMGGKVVGGPGTDRIVHYRASSANFFTAMSMAIARGRDFLGADESPNAARVAIVNETMTRRFWPDSDPLGKQITISFGPYVPASEQNAKLQRIQGDFTVIGVVRDARIFGSVRESHPEIYVPYAQDPMPSTVLVVQTVGDPAAASKSIVKAVTDINRNLLVVEVQPMEDMVNHSVSQPRFQAALIGALAGLALLLTSVGIYGVISYLTTQRTREIGIRMALGAQSADVLHMVVGEGARLLLVGLVVGFGAALWLTRYLESLLYGMQTFSLAAYGSAGVLLGAVALAASYLPARRAAAVDPILALRHE